MDIIIRYILSALLLFGFGYISYSAGKSFGKRWTIKQMQRIYVTQGPDIILAMLDPVVTEEGFANIATAKKGDSDDQKTNDRV